MYGEKTLYQSLKAIKEGSVSPDTLPPIDVMPKDGKHYVVNGNRRLYMYRLLEQKNKIQDIPVNVVQY